MCDIAGIHFQNSVWNAPVPLTREQILELNDSEAGAIVFKTRTLEPEKGNPDDWQLHHWGSTNNVALHNDGIHEVIKELQEIEFQKPVFLSLYGSFSELMTMIKLLNRLEIQLLIEINISCPNVSQTSLSAEEFNKLQTISHHPIGIKVNDKQELPDVKYAFISAINTIEGKGGKVIQQAALERVRALHQLFPAIPIIGIGGTETYADRSCFLQAGATAIEIGTAYLRWGVQVFHKPKTLLAPLIQTGGSWKLKSGDVSNIYIDMRKAPSHPFMWKQLVSLAVANVKDHKFDLVCGVPYGAVPLAAAIAYELNKPLIMCRKQEKEHGTKRKVEGEFVAGQKVLLVEDVVTTGNSMMEAEKELGCLGLPVAHRFALVQRSNRGWPRQTLFILQDLVDSPSHQLRKLIKKKKTKLCFAADIEDASELLKVLEKVAPHICMVKLHLDTLSNIPPDFNARLTELARQYEFFIMEDRKFLDIASIVEKQLERIRNQITVHFVTAHAAGGSKMLNVIPEDIGVFLVTDMSSDGAAEIKEFEHPRLTGVVSQKPRKECKLLRMVPGISLKQKKDEQNQRYRSPEDVQADIYVVGRGIYQAQDPAQAAQNYQNTTQRSDKKRITIGKK